MRSVRLLCLATILLGTTGIHAQPASVVTEEVSTASEAGRPSPGRFWARGEYLHWWIQGSALPPLVTTSPPDTAQANAGVLGVPGTSVLFGNERVNNDDRSGVRFRIGGWLDCEQSYGIEASFFALEGQANTFAAGSADGGNIVARPFLDPTGQGSSQLVSFPGLLAGTVTADASSSNLLGFDVVGRKALCCGPCYRLDAVCGYRFLKYDNSVRITEDLTPLAAPFIPGTRIVVRDDFGAQNQFHGAVFGLAGAYRRDCWTVELTTRLSVGKTFRDVTINGSTASSVPGLAPVVNTGGLLALPSNIGTYHSSDWAVIPEADLQVGYNVRPNVRVLFGYSFMLWTKVGRAGEQFDLTVNPNLIPPATAPIAGPARPGFLLQTSDMWIQGLSCGFEWQF